MQVSPDGRHVYAFGSSAGVLQRDGTDGTLAQDPARAGCLAEPDAGVSDCLVAPGAAAGSLAFSADGRQAYGAGPVIFDRDRKSGVLRRRTAAAACFSAADTGGQCTRLDELAVGLAPVLSPDGRNLYVLPSLDEARPAGAIAIYRRDPRSGALAPRPGVLTCRPLRQGQACGVGNKRGTPQSLAVSADGLNVYVALQDDGVAVFDRDPRDGALGQHLDVTGCVSTSGDRGACVRAPALAEVVNVVVAPDDRTVYALSRGPADTIAVLRREPRNGSLSQLDGRRGCISRTGSHGRCVIAGTSFADLSDLALSPDGRSAYAVGSGDGGLAVLDRNTATGALTLRGGKPDCFVRPPYNPHCTPTAAFGMPSSVVVSPDGANVYVAAAASDSIVVFDRDRAGLRPVKITPRVLPYRIFGGPSPPTRVLPDDELNARDSAVVRQFAGVLQQGKDANKIVGSSSARHRELTACLDLWADAPEALAITQLSALYEVALASRGAIARDADLRRTYGRLRGIEGLQRLPALLNALRVLERDRARVRAIADLTLNTCGVLRQWQATRWNADDPPPAIVRMRRLLHSSVDGVAATLAHAARLIAHNGGRNAREAAERLDDPLGYPESDFPACDTILNIIDPELVFCE